MALLAAFATVASAQNPQPLWEVSNTSDVDRTDIPFVMKYEEGLGDIRSAKVMLDNQEIPCQLDDLNQDGVFDELCFLLDLKAHQGAALSITFSAEEEQAQYPARVYAEMLLRNDKVKEKNKHNNFIESITARGDCANSYNIQHHHGVDFESEYNGIRIYFDKRQTLDLYGKFQKRLELKETQFYTSKEQKADRQQPHAAHHLLRTAAHHRRGNRQELEALPRQACHHDDHPLHAVCRQPQH